MELTYTRQGDYLIPDIALTPVSDRNAEPMAWARHMNAVKAQAGDIILRDPIYLEGGENHGSGNDA